MGSTRKRKIGKYVEIDREMGKAFREYDDLAVPPVRDYDSMVTDRELLEQHAHYFSSSKLHTLNADIPTDCALVPGKYSSVREEYLKEVTARLEAANKRRERKMGGRK